MKLPKSYRPIVAAEVSPDASLMHLADAIAKGQGGAFDLTVMHDDDCPKLSGGECVCEPEYRVGSPNPRGRN